MRPLTQGVMSEDAMKNRSFVAAPFILAWALNIYFLSLSRSGSTLMKLSALIILGPIAQSLNGGYLWYGYLILAAFIFAIGMSIYKHVSHPSILTGILTFLFLFFWFFIAVLYYEIDE